MPNYIPACNKCYDTGLCFQCNGTGNQLREGVELSEDCPECNGTGDCRICCNEVEVIDEHMAFN